MNEPTWWEIIYLGIITVPVIILLGFGLYCYLAAPKDYKNVRLHPERYKDNSVGTNWWDKIH